MIAGPSGVAYDDIGVLSGAELTRQSQRGRCWTTTLTAACFSSSGRLLRADCASPAPHDHGPSAEEAVRGRRERRARSGSAVLVYYRLLCALCAGGRQDRPRLGLL